MKRAAFIILVLVVWSCSTYGQPYQQEIRAWQKHYKEEFLTDSRSPLTAADTGFLRFFYISSRWRVPADVTLTPDAPAIDMATHSGKTKRFRPYASLRFANPASRRLIYDTLVAFERVDPPAGDTMAAKSLFIPFNDPTNGETTYGGGRYMDIMKAEVWTGRTLLDFNKAYNPWCVFAAGYSCPIPPQENRLSFDIPAGEKLPAPSIRAKE